MLIEIATDHPEFDMLRYVNLEPFESTYRKELRTRYNKRNKSKIDLERINFLLNTLELIDIALVDYAVFKTKM